MQFILYSFYYLYLDQGLHEIQENKHLEIVLGPSQKCYDIKISEIQEINQSFWMFTLNSHHITVIWMKTNSQNVKMSAIQFKYKPDNLIAPHPKLKNIYWLVLYVLSDMKSYKYKAT